MKVEKFKQVSKTKTEKKIKLLPEKLFKQRKYSETFI